MGLSTYLRRQIQKPSLALDFLLQGYKMNLILRAFAAIINFSRPTAATRVNAAGQIETLAANVPRFDYDPRTRKPLGLRLSADLGESALINKSLFYREDVGIWAIDGEFTNASLINDAVHGINGSGTLVIAYKNGIESIYSDDQLISSSPVIDRSNIPLILSGSVLISAIRYYPSDKSITSIIGDRRLVIDGIPLVVDQSPLAITSSISAA